MNVTRKTNELARLFRTTSHLSFGQIFWRVVHVARHKAYSLPGWPLPRLEFDCSAAAALTESLVLETTLPEQGATTVDLWARGLVQYHGVQGSSADWRATDKSRLWQYERHYHVEVMALAQAEVRAKDQIAANHVKALVLDWEKACPPLVGASWEPYPVARRILHWSVALASCPGLAPVLVGRLVPQLRHLAAHLERHLMGNHLLCDLFALVAGSAVVDAAGMESLWHTSAARLRKHLERQLLPDGGYAERTGQYHAIVLRDLLWATALSQARGRDLGLRNAATSMMKWACTVARPGRDFPWINDAAPDTTPSLASLRNLAAQVGIQSSATSPPSSAALPIVLPDTGWVIWRQGLHELLVDFGVVGPADQPGHGHADALAFELIWDGTPLITDTGITTYARGHDRDYERSAKAHATITVDGEGADEVWASFRVGGRSEPRLVDIEPDGSRMIITATCRSFRGWVHTRRVVFDPGHTLAVQDTVVGAPQGAEIVSHVPVAPGWTIEPRGGHLALTNGHQRLFVVTTKDASPEMFEGWQGVGFERKATRPVLAIPFVQGRAAYSISSNPPML